MALAFSTNRDIGEALVVSQVTFDNSYPTGGEAVTAADFGLSELDAVVVVGTRAVNTWRVTYNKAAGKLVAFVNTTGVEVAAAADLSTLVVDVVCVGS